MELCADDKDEISECCGVDKRESVEGMQERHDGSKSEQNSFEKLHNQWRKGEQWEAEMRLWYPRSFSHTGRWLKKSHGKIGSPVFYKEGERIEL